MLCSMTWPQYLRQECRHNGRLVRLSYYECELVSLLLMRRGQIVPRGETIEALYPDPDLEPDYAVTLLHQRCMGLRWKAPGLIELAHGRGLTIPIPSTLQMAA